MKQGSIVRAFNTLKTLTTIKGLPFGALCSLYQARKALTGYVEAQEQAELEVIRELGTVDEKGVITYNDPGTGAKELAKKLREIAETEIDPCIKPVTVKITQETADKLGLDGDILNTLDGFVTFELTE